MRIAFLLALSFLTFSAAAQTPELDLHVKDLMTATEFESAGLTKLTPQELQHLNHFMNAYTKKVAAILRPDRKSAAAAPPSAEVVESQIAGDFEGWSGETIFKLSNGQIWQQTEYDYEYEYAYMPEVTIYHTNECWKMKVEDMSDTICVKRLK